MLELSIALTGPYPKALFADQGADGDQGRATGHRRHRAGWVGVAVNGMSAAVRRVQPGQALASRSTCTPTDGRDIVRRLAPDADVVVQNFRPGTLDRHGLGYDDVQAGHPDVVYVSLSGFGAVGPYAGPSRPTTR